MVRNVGCLQDIATKIAALQISCQDGNARYIHGGLSDCCALVFSLSRFNECKDSGM